MSDRAKVDLAKSHDEVLAGVRSLTGGFRERAAAAEDARTIPQKSVDELFDAGLTRILVPTSLGGYGLGLETWFEVVREIGKADASHAWCASLLIHHPHYLCQFSEEAQTSVWADGLNVGIAGSILPLARIKRENGGFRISGEFPFCSGINHSRWLMVGGMLESEQGPPEWTFFIIKPGDFKVVDSWFTGAMCATGSNTAVCEDAWVPESHAIRQAEIREGKGPGGALHASPIYRAPFVSYGPLTFAAPMLGAAQGAYEAFRDWTKTRRGMRGIAIAEITSIQVRLARAAADLDAAELLLRRAADAAQAATPPSLELRARAMRDYARVAEFCVSAIDTILGMSGTAAFAASHPIQRAWRDIHLIAAHISLNPESNLAHYGRTELEVARDAHQPIY